MWVIDRDGAGLQSSMTNQALQWRSVGEGEDELHMSFFPVPVLSERQLGEGPRRAYRGATCHFLGQSSRGCCCCLLLSPRLPPIHSPSILAPWYSPKTPSSSSQELDLYLAFPKIKPCTR